jgi:hypothetical protein
MSIHRNDKVVCIDDSNNDAAEWICPNGHVAAGQVYVVEGVSEDGQGLFIVGLPIFEAEYPDTPASWRIERFRKLSDLKKEAGHAKLLRDIAADPEGDALRSIGMTESEIAALLGRKIRRE